MPNSKGSHIASGAGGRKERKRTAPEKEKKTEIIKAEPPVFEDYQEEIRENDATPGKKPGGRHLGGKIVLVIITLFVAAGIAGLGTVLLVTHGPSLQAKTLFVRTFKDTGTLKWVPELFISEEEVAELVNPVNVEGTKKYTIEKEAAVTEVTFEPVPEDEEVIELVDITGASWHGKMMIVRDPSLVRLAMPKATEEKGAWGEVKQVEEFCEMYGAIGGITAGGFYMDTGRPSGFVIKNGRVVVPNDSYKKLSRHFVGFTADHKLVVGTFTEQEALEKGVVEGLCWGPLLIVDGIKQTGQGGGYNPRAAIGQRADGTVVLVLIEGRMISSLGASYDDLADFMEEQGCINACNLDSGRSSVMIYEGVPVTKIAVGAGIQTENRAAPNAFVVMPEGWTDD